MKQTINFSDFRDSFSKMGRSDNFSYEGQRALFGYLEDLESDTGEEIELDVIALCCDFTEWTNLDEFNKEHDEAASVDEILDRTILIKIDGSEGFITQNN